MTSLLLKCGHPDSRANVRTRERPTGCGGTYVVRECRACCAERERKRTDKATKFTRCGHPKVEENMVTATRGGTRGGALMCRTCAERRAADEERSPVRLAA